MDRFELWIVAFAALVAVNAQEDPNRVPSRFQPFDPLQQRQQQQPQAPQSFQQFTLFGTQRPPNNVPFRQSLPSPQEQDRFRSFAGQPFSTQFSIQGFSQPPQQLQPQPQPQRQVQPQPVRQPQPPPARNSPQRGQPPPRTQPTQRNPENPNPFTQPTQRNPENPNPFTKPTQNNPENPNPFINPEELRGGRLLSPASSRIPPTANQRPFGNTRPELEEPSNRRPPPATTEQTFRGAARFTPVDFEFPANPELPRVKNPLPPPTTAIPTTTTARPLTKPSEFDEFEAFVPELIRQPETRSTVQPQERFRPTTQPPTRFQRPRVNFQRLLDQQEAPNRNTLVPNRPSVQDRIVLPVENRPILREPVREPEVDISAEILGNLSPPERFNPQNSQTQDVQPPRREFDQENLGAAREWSSVGGPSVPGSFDREVDSVEITAPELVNQESFDPRIPEPDSVQESINPETSDVLVKDIVPELAIQEHDVQEPESLIPVHESRETEPIPDLIPIPISPESEPVQEAVNPTSVEASEADFVPQPFVPKNPEVQQPESVNPVSFHVPESANTANDQFSDPEPVNVQNVDGQDTELVQGSAETAFSPPESAPTAVSLPETSIPAIEVSEPFLEPLIPESQEPQTKNHSESESRPSNEDPVPPRSVEPLPEVSPNTKSDFDYEDSDYIIATEIIEEFDTDGAPHDTIESTNAEVSLNVGADNGIDPMALVTESSAEVSVSVQTAISVATEPSLPAPKNITMSKMVSSVSASFSTKAQNHVTESSPLGEDTPVLEQPRIVDASQIKNEKNTPIILPDVFRDFHQSPRAPVAVATPNHENNNNSALIPPTSEPSKDTERQSKAIDGSASIQVLPTEEVQKNPETEEGIESPQSSFDNVEDLDRIQSELSSSAFVNGQFVMKNGNKTKESSETNDSHDSNTTESSAAILGNLKIDAISHLLPPGFKPEAANETHVPEPPKNTAGSTGPHRVVPTVVKPIKSFNFFNKWLHPNESSTEASTTATPTTKASTSATSTTTSAGTSTTQPSPLATLHFEDASALLPPGFKIPVADAGASTTASAPVVTKSLIDTLLESAADDVKGFLPPGFKNYRLQAETAQRTSTAAPATEMTSQGNHGDSTTKKIGLVFPTTKPGTPRPTTAKHKSETTTHPSFEIRTGWPVRVVSEFTGYPTSSTTPVTPIENIEISVGSTTTTSTTTARTTTTTTPEPRVTTPGVCGYHCRLQATIRLVNGIQWMPEFSDPNTREWRRLRNTMEDYLNEVYQKGPLASKYDRVVIEGFSRGSILVDYYLLLNDTIELDTAEIRSSFHAGLTKTEGELKIGDFTVDEQSTDFIVLAPIVDQVRDRQGEGQGGGVSEWVIAASVVGLASLIFVIAFGTTVLVRRRINNQKRSKNVPLTDEMLNELNRNHMSQGIVNVGADEFYDMNDGWDEPPYVSRKPPSTTSRTRQVSRPASVAAVRGYSNFRPPSQENWKNDWNGQQYSSQYALGRTSVGSGRYSSSSMGYYGRKKPLDYDNDF